MKTTAVYIISVLILSSCYENRERFGGSSTTPISTRDVFEETCDPVENGQVEITGLVFSPAVETIQRYDVVKWQNHDTETHTVTAGLSIARSEIFDITLSPGQQRCLRFLKTGRYDYFSKSRLDMRGQIIVE
jgi:plastocyanin